MYRGCCIKFFSRKQEVPALSSAEAEIISIVDTAKEMVSLGMLLQTMIQGIPLDPLGMPLQTTGEMGLTIQNERFVRGFPQISYNKASKTNVSRDASDNFHRKFAFRHSFVPSTHRILREGSSSKSKMCVSLQRRAIPHFKIHVLLQRRTQKCMNQAQEARGNTRHTKITILPQFRTSDQHEVTRGLQNEVQNSHFTSVLDVR